MTTPDDQHRNEAYRAIGRYVVEFSRLIYHMRNRLEGRLTREDDSRTAAILALSETYAAQIANAFFAVCGLEDLDSDEKKIASKLQKEVIKEINRRNDIAHGDWWVGGGPSPHGVWPDPALWRAKASRKDEPIQFRDLPIEELDRASDGLHELVQSVALFGDLCLFGGPLGLQWIIDGRPARVSDALMMRDGEVVPTPRLMDVTYR
jgi:hypothetical protein